MKIVDISERMPIGVRSFKHTPLALGAFLPDIISGGAGILSSLIGGFSQNKSVADTNATNLQIARETNQMQLDAMREQNKFNRDTALEMFNLENAYNTPGAQAARLLEYGFNPGVALGNGAVGASMASASAPTSSGLPTFVNPTMQAPPSVLMSAADSISKLAGAAAQFSQARKTSKETSWIDQEMEANIKDLFADIKYKEVQSSYDEFRMSVDKVFAPFERAMGMRKLADQIKNLGMEYTLAMSRNETEKANALVAKAQEKLISANEDQVRQSTPIIIDNLKKTGQEIVSRTNANNASAESSRAQAAMTREEHQRLIDTHEDFVEMSHIARRHQRIDYTTAAATMQDYIEQCHNNKLISDEQYNKVRNEIEMLEKEMNWYNFNQVIGTIERINNGINKWAPWAFSRTDEVTTYGIDSKGRRTESHSVHNTSYHR